MTFQSRRAPDARIDVTTERGLPLGMRPTAGREQVHATGRPGQINALEWPGRPFPPGEVR